MIRLSFIWMLLFPLVLAAIIYVLLTSGLWPFGVLLIGHAIYIMTRPSQRSVDWRRRPGRVHPMQRSPIERDRWTS